MNRRNRIGEACLKVAILLCCAVPLLSPSVAPYATLSIATMVIIGDALSR